MTRIEQNPAPAASTGDASGTDVGRWFATATAPGAAVARGLPRLPAWGPDPRGGYGIVSAPEVVDEALAVLRRASPAAVLTGAGMSTGAGLPDYRGADAVPRSPMTIQEFTGSDLARRRYWARATVGWSHFTRARPGRAHELLAQLGRAVPLTAVITQNVDALHQAAGSDPVIDLHGRLDTVRCLGCGAKISRAVHHERLLTMNPQVARRLPELAAETAQAPDGDAEVDRTADFRYPVCALCGGMLKPDVVFFGESAERARVDAAFEAVADSGALLVLGSSLTVMSGLRFVRRARADGLPVVIVNDGPTRGDELATVRVHGRIEDVLSTWYARLAGA
ncbi:Sir2 family NAD-dependent protein deacetylase [Brachybacterium nesterenkovii]|uniref:protein acetyllysine N-acetyltransferase n=1 Tax=Brachybacterium nesterenkovii TaxID=47847 RepID=A0A1X6WXR8_9MICO|nr:Sir2 family NAD-dependent protein deacetylase [Brachybacterium nesterenkovii]SLM90517.1 NAD-dependent protein deacetylase of SIR2 family [Brachybacterium nesterenkovii]